MVGSAWSTSYGDPNALESARPRARRRTPEAEPLGDLSFASQGPEAAPAQPSTDIDPIQLSYDPTRMERAQPQLPLSTPGHQAPATQAPRPPATPSTFESTAQFRTTLEELNQATDPQQQAVLKDKLSRDLATSLQAAGHKVSFKGDQVIVDGRPYVVGGQPSNGNTGIGGAGRSIDQPAGSPGSVGHNGATASGLNREQYRDLWQGGGQFATMEELAQFVAEHGGQIVSGNGTVLTPFGEHIDMLENARGAADGKGPAKRAWGGSGGGGGSMDMAAGGRSALGGGFDGLSFEGLPSGPGGRAAAGGRGVGPLSGAGSEMNWSDFMGDLEGLSGSLPMGSMGPGYSPDGLEDGALDTETEGLVLDLLKNPESLDPKTLEILKTQSREELADLAESDDETLRAMGTEMGIDDSNWLASERLARRDSRNNAIVSGNRELEIEAATRRGEDRRSAASIGMTAAAQKTQKKALRESFKQKAAELGMSEAQVRLDHTRTLLSAVGSKYGIDIGAGLDLKKLSTMDRQFQEELAFKLQQLAQADEQFGASLGLSYDELNSENDQNAFNNWFMTTFAGGN